MFAMTEMVRCGKNLRKNAGQRRLKRSWQSPRAARGGCKPGHSLQRKKENLRYFVSTAARFENF
jgi:hypothetical protein